MIEAAGRVVFDVHEDVAFNPCISANVVDTERLLAKRGRLLIDPQFEREEVPSLCEDIERGRVRGPKDIKFHLIPPNPHGLNAYRMLNTVVYLSAVNPSPSLVRFFRFRIPNYRPELDFAGDSAVQAITRTTVRVHNPGNSGDEGEPIFVIVPNLHLSNIVGLRMNSREENTHEHYQPGEFKSLASLETRWAEDFPYVNVGRLPEFGIRSSREFRDSSRDKRIAAHVKWKKELGREYLLKSKEYVRGGHSTQVKNGLLKGRVDRGSSKAAIRRFCESVQVLKELVEIMEKKPVDRHKDKDFQEALRLHRRKLDKALFKVEELKRPSKTLDELYDID
jgi:hypothetical protein